MNERPREGRERESEAALSADAAFEAKAAKILFSSSSLSLIPLPATRRRMRQLSAFNYLRSHLYQRSWSGNGKESFTFPCPPSTANKVVWLQVSNLQVRGSAAMTFSISAGIHPDTHEATAHLNFFATRRGRRHRSIVGGAVIIPRIR